MICHPAALGHGRDHAAESSAHLNSPHVLVNHDMEWEHAVEQAGLGHIAAGIGLAGNLSLFAQALVLLWILHKEHLQERLQLSLAAAEGQAQASSCHAMLCVQPHDQKSHLQFP